MRGPTFDPRSMAYISAKGISRHAYEPFQAYLNAEAERLGVEITGFGLAYRSLSACAFFIFKSEEATLALVNNLVDEMWLEVEYQNPGSEKRSVAPMPKKLVEVRRTDTTLTLISEQHGNTHEMTCGVHGHYCFGWTLVNIGNSLDTEPGGLIALTLKDEQGTVYGYTVWTDDLDKFLPQLQPERYNIFRAIKYADDHITISYNHHGTLELGLVPDQHRFTLAYYAVDFGESVGPVGMTFGFLDEDGDQHRISFSASANDIWRVKAELSAFTEAFAKQHNPKPEAATLPHTLQQAA